MSIEEHNLSRNGENLRQRTFFKQKYTLCIDLEDSIIKRVTYHKDIELVLSKFRQQRRKNEFKNIIFRPHDLRVGVNCTPETCSMPKYKLN